MPQKNDMAMMQMFNMIIENKLSPNEFYLLYCIREGIASQFINLHAELRKLIDKEYIRDKTDATGFKYELEPKAMSITAKVESFFKINKKKTSMQLLGKDFTDNMTKYNEIFPRKKAGSGKYMRSNIKNVETNFRWFFENYTYSWETILEATALYITHQFAADYKYTRTSMYFIRKQDKGIVSSDLADYCEIIEGGEQDNDAEIFREKVV